MLSSSATIISSSLCRWCIDVFPGISTCWIRSGGGSKQSNLPRTMLGEEDSQNGHEHRSRSKLVKILLSRPTLETISRVLSRTSVASAPTVRNTTLPHSLVRYRSWTSPIDHWRQTLQASLKLWSLSRECPVLRDKSRGNLYKTGRGLL